jgi:hypothetical protein
MRSLIPRRGVRDATLRQILATMPRYVWIILAVCITGLGLAPVGAHRYAHRSDARQAALVRRSVSFGMTPAEAVRAVSQSGMVIRADAACRESPPRDACREIVIGLRGEGRWRGPIPVARLLFDHRARLAEIEDLQLPWRERYDQ